MSKADAVAGVLWVGVTLYAVFGGADFGAGLWALLAGGGERGKRPRALIDWAIGPVWEANHVWLIFVLVVLWTAFPEAFGSIFSTLFIPLSLAALGIVLRGAGFAFHKLAPRVGGQRAARGAVRRLVRAHALLHGHRRGRDRRRAGCRSATPTGDAVTSWLNPLSLLDRGAVRRDRRLPVGGLPDQRRPPASERDDLERYFRARALAAAVVAGVFAVAGIFVAARRRALRLRPPHRPRACRS